MARAALRRRARDAMWPRDMDAIIWPRVMDRPKARDDMPPSARDAMWLRAREAMRTRVN